MNKELRTKIVFCDFDGVLCHERYWRSLPDGEREQVQELLFRDDTTIVRGWMRGKYSAEEVNRIVSKNTGIPYGRLWNVFVRDCETMCVSEAVLKMLRALRERYILILTTDNMDSFSRFTVPALQLHGHFDRVSNSFLEGIGKMDNGGEVFLNHAAVYGVSIRECIVFDDSKDTCRLFRELGGTSYLVTLEQDLSYHLQQLL